MAYEVLLNALDELGEDEFQHFKWILKEECLKNSSTIPWSKLENAKTWDTVSLMIQTYTLPGAVELTHQVLKKINRNDLVQSSSARSSGTKSQSQEDKHDVTEMHFSVFPRFVEDLTHSFCLQYFFLQPIVLYCTFMQPMSVAESGYYDVIMFLHYQRLHLVQRTTRHLVTLHFSQLCLLEDVIHEPKEAIKVDHTIKH
uniref:Pyrin domain-containing protein n=1 Tax=Sander lucioperca TaxID=283035 RepID=A0A8D0CX63_SANLU